MRAKMHRPPEAMSRVSPEARRLRLLPRWPRRKPLTIKVKFRGGSEAWVEIHARGAILRTPGHVCIIDVLARIWNDA